MLVLTQTALRVTDVGTNSAADRIVIDGDEYEVSSVE